MPALDEPACNRLALVADGFYVGGPLRAGRAVNADGSINHFARSVWSQNARHALVADLVAFLLCAAAAMTLVHPLI